jgi:hypothetical protein
MRPGKEDAMKLRMLTLEERDLIVRALRAYPAVSVGAGVYWACMELAAELGSRHIAIPQEAPISDGGPDLDEYPQE